MGDERTLTYQSGEAVSAARWWAWLLMWLVGILYCFGGVTLGVVAIGAAILDARSGFGPSVMDSGFLAELGLGAMIPVSIGVAFAYGAGRVWRGSRGWARGGRVLALINMALFLVEIGGMTYGLATDPPRRDEWLPIFVVGFLFLFLMVGLVGMAWSLGRVMREVAGGSA